MQGNGKTKVAVLGGGVGAMTAAFYLTSTEDLRNKYDVTVYQMGWRLGGKGASGRNMDADKGRRIQEHGLHVWMGFYDNAFRAITAAYDELREKKLVPNSPFQSRDDAFHPQHWLTVMEHFEGEWLPWNMYIPPNDEIPGTPSAFLEPWDYLREMLRFLVVLFEENMHRVSDRFDRLHIRHFRLAQEARPRSAPRVTGEASQPDESSASEDTVLHVAHELVKQHPHPRNARLQGGILDEAEHWVLKEILKAALAAVHAVEKALDPVRDNALRRFLIVLDLGLTISIGIVQDKLYAKGFDAIDNQDLRQWLQAKGSQHAFSPLVRAVYDMSFAYEKGIVDEAHASFAAGTGIRAFLRIFFAYKGAVFWRMNAGMGDTIFSPLFLVLRSRGVKFEFLHRVNEIRASADGKLVSEIELEVQATVNGGGEYEPLITVENLPCWPDRPLYEQIEQGEALRVGKVNLESAWTDWKGVGTKCLKLGEDFDEVVLGISLDAIRYVGQSLISAQPRFKEMIESVKTVQTQALQAWFRKTSAQMGWEAPTPDPELAQMCTYTEPMDTWADMSYLTERETWKPDEGVQSVSYFCSPMADAENIPPPGTDPAFPQSQLERVRGASVRMLDTQIRPLFPRAARPDHPNGLDWNLLVDPTGAGGPDRVNFQWIRANIDPTERYVLSVAGSLTKSPIRLIEFLASGRKEPYQCHT